MKNVNLTEEEKINAYLDNQLPDDMIDGVVNNINSNPYLNDEYEQLSKVTSILNKKSVATDSSVFKAAILTNIGLSNADVSRYSKYTAIFYSFVLLLVTFVSTMSVNNYSDFIGDTSTNIIAQNSVDEKATIEKENIINSANNQSNLLAPIIISKTKKHTTIYKNLIISDNSLINKTLTSIPPLPIEEDEYSKNNNIAQVVKVGKSMINTFDGFGVTNIFNMKELPYIYFYSNPEIFRRFHLSVNWYNLSNNYPQLSLLESNGLFRNLSMSLLYEINSNNLIGVSVGYDNYMMEFNRWEGQNKYQYSQEFITEWIGISYTHNFATLGFLADKYRVYPFSNITVAYMKTGTASSINTGVGIDINQAISLNLGLNTSMLLFHFDAKYWTSYKYGFNLGMNINL